MGSRRVGCCGGREGGGVSTGVCSTLSLQLFLFSFLFIREE